MSIKTNTNKIIEQLVQSKRYFIYRICDDKIIRGTFHAVLYGKDQVAVRFNNSLFLGGDSKQNITKYWCFPLLWIIKIETLDDILKSITAEKIRKLPPEIWHYIDEFL